MRSVFEDPGNMRALGLVKENKTFKIHIREPAELTTKDEDLFFKTKSLLLYNKIKFEVETIIN